MHRNEGWDWEPGAGTLVRLKTEEVKKRNDDSKKNTPDAKFAATKNVARKIISRSSRALRSAGEKYNFPQKSATNTRTFIVLIHRRWWRPYGSTDAENANRG